MEKELIAVKDVSILNAALRSAGLSLDFTSTAVMYELVKLFDKKKDDISLKEISSLVQTVLSNTELNPPKKEEAPKK